MRANFRDPGRRDYVHMSWKTRQHWQQCLGASSCREHRLLPAGRSAGERRPEYTLDLKLRMLLCSVLAYEKNHLVLVKPK